MPSPHTHTHKTNKQYFKLSVLLNLFKDIFFFLLLSYFLVQILDKKRFLVSFKIANVLPYHIQIDIIQMKGSWLIMQFTMMKFKIETDIFLNSYDILKALGRLLLFGFAVLSFYCHEVS